jgi:hypothetical protein
MALFAYDLQQMPVMRSPEEVAFDMEPFRQTLRKVPIIVADNVADYLADLPSPTINLGLLAPPFPGFWIEHRRWGKDGVGWQLGGLFVVKPNTRFEVVGTVYGRKLGYTRGCLYMGHGTLHLNAGGYPLVAPKFALNREAFEEAAGKDGTELWLPMLLTITFMHCKNVARVEHKPDPALVKRNRERGKPYMLKYHTIEIEPMKSVLRGEGRIETVGLERALHICRGHFAYYPADGPGLFGKGVHGQFWKPAHARGTEKKGVVIADYKVHSPEKI